MRRSLWSAIFGGYRQIKLDFKKYKIMKKSLKKFIGTDINLEISLFEYGLICTPYKKNNYQDEYFCIYRQGENFGTGYIRESDLNSLMYGEDCMRNKDIFDLLDYVGSQLDEWFELPFIQKLSDLLSYYGSENIFGTDYYPSTEKEIRKIYQF